MSKQRAFVRYTKSGRIVPGSMIVTNGSYPNGPALWAEAVTDLCCDDPAFTSTTNAKAFIRYTKSGKIVPGSLVISNSYPKNTGGIWREVFINLCCDATSSFNFDITADWSLTTPSVVDEASFKTFLESGQDGDGNTNDQTGVVITNFLLEGNRLRCNVSSIDGENLAFSLLNITDITSFGNLQITDDLYLYQNNITSVDSTIWPVGVKGIYLNDNNITSVDSVTWPSTLNNLRLSTNLLTSFDPINPLPAQLLFLVLAGNLLTSFDPSLPLPSLLTDLNLNNNQIVTFDPSIALPNSVQELYLENNQIVTFNPSIALPTLGLLQLGGNQIVIFNPTVALPDTIQSLELISNQMTTAGYTASEPWANAMSVIPGRGTVYFNGNIDSASGTTLQTILISKGWSVSV